MRMWNSALGAGTPQFPAIYKKNTTTESRQRAGATLTVRGAQGAALRYADTRLKQETLRHRDSGARRPRRGPGRDPGGGPGGGPESLPVCECGDGPSWLLPSRALQPCASVPLAMSALCAVRSRHSEFHCVIFPFNREDFQCSYRVKREVAAS